MKLTGTGGQDPVLSQANTLTKNRAGEEKIKTNIVATTLQLWLSPGGKQVVSPPGTNKTSQTDGQTNEALYI